MKKILLILIAVFMASTGAYAQFSKLNILNHIAVGANVGTTGIGADLAVPVTKFVEVEAGFSIMPKITYSTNVHLNVSTYNAYGVSFNLDDIPVQGKLKMANGKVMINVLPIPTSGFHLTVGAYFGNADVVELYNTEEGQLAPVNLANNAINEYNRNFGANYENIGIKLGDYLLTPDENGNARATLNTKKFKPYVGLGFGRAIPKKRVNFKFDLGAMFWGTPDVVDHNGVSLSKQDWEGKDGGAFRIIQKIKVYPVLNFRIAGRII